MADVPNAISVRGLQKSYNDVHAIRGIDLDIEVGEVFGLLGPNGAGKTSTVEILEGYRDRDAGEVSVLGIDPRNATRKWRQRIGIVLQECGFPQYATVQELVDLWAAYYPAPRSIEEVIDVVGLGEKRNNRVRQLSGGQKRRLDLALSLVGDPELIFLDEPTTGFDPSARRTAWDIVRRLQSLGKTILLTTHYMDEAQILADRVAVMTRGEIVALGKPEQIGADEVRKTRIRFSEPPNLSIGDIPAPEADITKEHGYIIISTTNPVAITNAVTNWALQQNIELEGFSVQKPTLEEIYLDLVGTDGDTRELSDAADAQ